MLFRTQRLVKVEEDLSPQLVCLALVLCQLCSSTPMYPCWFPLILIPIQKIALGVKSWLLVSASRRPWESNVIITNAIGFYWSPGPAMLRTREGTNDSINTNRCGYGSSVCCLAWRVEAEQKWISHHHFPSAKGMLVVPSCLSISYGLAFLRWAFSSRQCFLIGALAVTASLALFLSHTDFMEPGGSETSLMGSISSKTTKLIVVFFQW